MNTRFFSAKTNALLRFMSCGLVKAVVLRLATAENKGELISKHRQLHSIHRSSSLAFSTSLHTHCLHEGAVVSSIRTRSMKEDMHE
jgi:hypothetical protein